MSEYVREGGPIGWVGGMSGPAPAPCGVNAPCADASRCPPGTGFVTTRSVPEGGMCVTAEAYGRVASAAVPRMMSARDAQQAPIPGVDTPAYTIIRWAIGLGSVAIVGIATYFLVFRKKKGETASTALALRARTANRKKKRKTRSTR